MHVLDVVAVVVPAVGWSAGSFGEGVEHHPASRRLVLALRRFRSDRAPPTRTNYDSVGICAAATDELVAEPGHLISVTSAKNGRRDGVLRRCWRRFACTATYLQSLR